MAFTCWRGLAVLVPVFSSNTDRFIGNGLSTGAGGIKGWIAHWHRDWQGFAGAGVGQAHIVVDELAPGVDHGAHQTVVGGALAVLITECVADLPATGQTGSRRTGDTIRVSCRGNPEIIGASLTPFGMGQIVATPIDGPKRKQHGRHGPFLESHQIQADSFFAGKA